MSLTVRELDVQEAAREALARREYECPCGRRLHGSGSVDTRWFRPGEAEPPFGRRLFHCPSCRRVLP